MSEESLTGLDDRMSAVLLAIKQRKARREVHWLLAEPLAEEAQLSHLTAVAKQDRLHEVISRRGAY